MRLTVARGLILCALGLAAFLIYPRVNDFIAMDKCLDSGGTYAYGVCGPSTEGVSDIPNSTPVLIGSTVAASAVMLLGAAVFVVRDRSARDTRAT
jgi:hypothetical protein